MELTVKIQSRKGHVNTKEWIHPLIIIDEGSGGDTELWGMICSNPSSRIVILGQGESPGQLMHVKWTYMWYTTAAQR
jgi:hypothetical protein